MQSANPVVIPRNHQVAAAIADAEVGDYGHLEQAFTRWRSPFKWTDNDLLWAATPDASERVTRTFCGLKLAFSKTSDTKTYASIKRHVRRNPIARYRKGFIIAAATWRALGENRISGKTVSGPFTIPSASSQPHQHHPTHLRRPSRNRLSPPRAGPVPRAGNREPVYSQYAPGCFVNAVGLTNPGAEEARKGFESSERAGRSIPLVSIFGGSIEEFVEVAKILAPVADGLELNLVSTRARLAAWRWDKTQKWCAPL